MIISFDKKTCPAILSDIQEILDMEVKIKDEMEYLKVIKSSILFRCRQEDKDMIADFEMKVSNQPNEDDRLKFITLISSLTEQSSMLRCIWYFGDDSFAKKDLYKIIRFSIIWEADY